MKGLDLWMNQIKEELKWFLSFEQEDEKEHIGGERGGGEKDL